MGFNISKIAGAVGLASTMVLAGASGAAAQDRMQIQTHFNPTLSVIGEAFGYFSESLERIGGDTLRVRPYNAGALVPTFETFDAVASGTLDATWGWPGYFMGKIPALTLFASVPFGPDVGEYVAWLIDGDGEKLAQEVMAKHGVHGIFCGAIAAEASGWFRREINSVEDLRGLKIRYAGLGGEVLAKFGASITLLAAGEIFPNLERGVIDATEFSMPSIDKVLGFYKVANHYYFPGWHQPGSVSFLMVNQRKWDSLSDRSKAVLEVTCRATVAWEVARGIGQQAEAMAYFGEQGVQFHTWSEEMMEAFRKATTEVMEEQSAIDEDFRRLYENQQAFLAGVRDWSLLSDIPPHQR